MKMDINISKMAVNNFYSLESRFIKKHKGIYSYEFFIYKNMHTKGIIKCKSVIDLGYDFILKVY